MFDKDQFIKAWKIKIKALEISGSMASLFVCVCVCEIAYPCVILSEKKNCYCVLFCGDERFQNKGREYWENKEYSLR